PLRLLPPAAAVGELAPLAALPVCAVVVADEAASTALSRSTGGGALSLKMKYQMPNAAAATTTSALALAMSAIRRFMPASYETRLRSAYGASRRAASSRERNMRIHRGWYSEYIRRGSSSVGVQINAEDAWVDA